MSGLALRRTYWGLGALVLAASLGLARDDQDELKGDLKSLQGAWSGTGLNGQEARWSFEGTKVTAKVGDMEYVTKVKLDEKAKPYPTMDFEVVESPDGSDGSTALGIYKLEADSLTIVVSPPGVESRPDRLEAVEDVSHLFKMTREKGK